MIILLQNSIHQNGSLVSIFPLKHLNLKKLSTFHNGKSFISSEKMSLNLLKYYCKFIETINHSQNFVFNIFRLTILSRTAREAQNLGDNLSSFGKFIFSFYRIPKVSQSESLSHYVPYNHFLQVRLQVFFGWHTSSRYQTSNIL